MPNVTIPDPIARWSAGLRCGASHVGACLLLVVSLLVLGCGDDGSGGPTALFEVPRAGAPPVDGFYALPYPNDIRVDDAGSIDLSDHIRPNDIIALYLDTVSERQRGFSTNAASFFRFDAEVDSASLPQSPSASLEDSASVYLLNIDPASPARGQRTPLRFQFELFEGEAIGTFWLSVLPFAGFPLEERTTYAVVVTNRLRAANGLAIGADDDFRSIASETASSDPALARAQRIYQPLWDQLAAGGGDDRSTVIAASVFTTQDATSLMGDVRRVVRQQAEPVARDIVFVSEQNGYALYDGLYDAPNFQSGSVPYRVQGGDIQLDDRGDPIVQRTEEMRFSFTVPTTTPPAAGWPVVIYAHGTGGDYHSYRRRSDLLAPKGIAMIGIDQVLHGPRNLGASPDISFFNFQNPLAARDNTLQGALDNFQLVRLIEGFDYSDSTNSRTVRFDTSRIYFMGHSQGGLTGPPFLVHEPNVNGAVLSGAGGLIYLSLLLKTEPVDISALLQAFIRDFPLDEFNPILAIVQGWIDAADPANYARYLVRQPRDGVGAKHILQTEGFVDRFTPPPSIEALATAIGSNQVGPIIQRLPGLALRDSETLTLPVTGNQDGVTSVLLQYDEVAGSDGHFVIFDVPAARQQMAEFFGTMATDGVPTIVAPD